MDTEGVINTVNTSTNKESLMECCGDNPRNDAELTPDEHNTRAEISDGDITEAEPNRNESVNETESVNKSSTVAETADKPDTVVETADKPDTVNKCEETAYTLDTSHEFHEGKMLDKAGVGSSSLLGLQENPDIHVETDKSSSEQRLMDQILHESSTIQDSSVNLDVDQTVCDSAPLDNADGAGQFPESSNKMSYRKHQDSDRDQDMSDSSSEIDSSDLDLGSVDSSGDDFDEPPLVADKMDKSGTGTGDKRRRLPGVKTKGEMLPEDLPPIEDLVITVDEKVVMVEVGTVLNIVDTLVIVQAHKHMPALNMDTILFLSEKRVLGMVFETFGPVALPLYSVRFNSNDQIVERGVTAGVLVYYAPEAPEFTHYVFMEHLKELKGSDASWEHNNEPPDHFIDYSDDEQERSAKSKQMKEKKSERDGADSAETNHKRGNRGKRSIAESKDNSRNRFYGKEKTDNTPGQTRPQGQTHRHTNAGHIHRDSQPHHMSTSQQEQRYGSSRMFSPWAGQKQSPETTSFHKGIKSWPPVSCQSDGKRGFPPQRGIAPATGPGQYQSPPGQGNFGAAPPGGMFGTASGGTGTFGTPPSNMGQFGAPHPNAGQFGAPLSNSGPFGTPPPNTGQFRAPPPHTGPFGAPPPNTDQFRAQKSNSGPYGAPPSTVPFGAPQSNSGSFRAPLSNSGSFGAPLPNSGPFGAPPNAGPSGAPPSAGPFGAPPPRIGQYGVPPKEGGPFGGHQPVTNQSHGYNGAGAPGQYQQAMPNPSERPNPHHITPMDNFPRPANHTHIGSSEPPQQSSMRYQQPGERPTSPPQFHGPSASQPTSQQCGPQMLDSRFVQNQATRPAGMHSVGPSSGAVPTANNGFTQRRDTFPGHGQPPNTDSSGPYYNTSAPGRFSNVQFGGRPQFPQRPPEPQVSRSRWGP